MHRDASETKALASWKLNFSCSAGSILNRLLSCKIELEGRLRNLCFCFEKDFCAVHRKKRGEL